MNNKYTVFEHFAYACEVDIQVFNLTGETLYASKSKTSGYTNHLFKMLDCESAERMALLYGCYQARRFGGRYAFIAPSCLTYCASPIIESGGFTAGAVAGPFLMIDYDEYLTLDIADRYKPSDTTINSLRTGIENIPIITPTKARAINEQLFICTHYHTRLPELSEPIHTTALSYPLDKEDDLLAAVSRGDIRLASAVLNDILGQILFHSGNDIETLRARVFELIVLLSRAALKGGANIDAIFGLKYEILREIDALSTAEDIGPWIHGVTRRFGQHVFDFTGAKRVDTIHKAIDYINNNYMNKLTLQDIADHVFLSPTYFSKVFKDETAQTPIGFLTAVRVEASKKLLRDTNVNISEIPGLVGFEDQSYFTRVFKKIENQTPADYRKKGLRR